MVNPTLEKVGGSKTTAKENDHSNTTKASIPSSLPSTSSIGGANDKSNNKQEESKNESTKNADAAVAKTPLSTTTSSPSNISSKTPLANNAPPQTIQQQKTTNKAGAEENEEEEDEEVQRAKAIALAVVAAAFSSSAATPKHQKITFASLHGAAGTRNKLMVGDEQQRKLVEDAKHRHHTQKQSKQFSEQHVKIADSAQPSNTTNQLKIQNKNSKHEQPPQHEKQQQQRAQLLSKHPSETETITTTPSIPSKQKDATVRLSSIVFLRHYDSSSPHTKLLDTLQHHSTAPKWRKCNVILPKNSTLTRAIPITESFETTENEKRKEEDFKVLTLDIIKHCATIHCPPATVSKNEEYPTPFVLILQSSPAINPSSPKDIPNIKWEMAFSNHVTSMIWLSTITDIILSSRVELINSTLIQNAALNSIKRKSNVILNKKSSFSLPTEEKGNVTNLSSSQQLSISDNNKEEKSAVGMMVNGIQRTFWTCESYTISSSSFSKESNDALLHSPLAAIKKQQEQDLRQEEENEMKKNEMDKTLEEKRVEVYGVVVSSKDALLALFLLFNGCIFGRNSFIFYMMLQFLIWYVIVIIHDKHDTFLEQYWMNIVTFLEEKRRNVTKLIFGQLEEAEKKDLLFQKEKEQHQQQQQQDISKPKKKLHSKTIDWEMDAIKTKCPISTLQEQRRFLKARKNNVQEAVLQLNEYLEWRNELNLDDLFQKEIEKRKKVGDEAMEENENDCLKDVNKEKNEDVKDWIMAYKAAVAYETNTSSSSTMENVNNTPQLPQLVFTHTSRTINSNSSKGETPKRILHVLPARLNLKLATPQTYSLAIAIYLDHKFSHSSLEKADVVVDLRGGYGWSNPRPTAAFPFIKSVSSLLERHFPERLDRCILYPLPKPMSPLWNMAKKFLDVDTASKICVCFGGGNLDSPIPESVGDYLEKDVVERMERIRKSLFC